VYPRRSAVCFETQCFPELTEYIRTQSWQAEVPILMVTSEQNMGRLAAVERAGVSAICDKPFEAGNIRRLISDALTR
jgi:two-component system chemotaxis response regulator CheY